MGNQARNVKGRCMKNFLANIRLNRGAWMLGLLGTLAALPAFAAPGKLTGQISVNPPEPIVGKQAVINLGATGDVCWIRINYGDGAPSDNVTVNGSSSAGGNKPNAGGVVPKIYANPGTYTITVKGSPGSSPSCQGEASITVKVKPLVLKLPAMTPTICANGFENQTGSPQDGELRCRKNPQACPTHWEGSVESATGKLECTPKAVTCPEGWVGGMQGGKLVCNSAPLPKVQCSDSTPTNQWGASYYTEGWRIYGCSKNMAPPK
jgi:hypothetical protein